MATEMFSPLLLPALFAAAAAALALSGCSVSVDVAGGEERIETETVPASGITTLDVTTDNGRIEVSGGEVANIEIATIFHEHDVGDGSSDMHADGDRLELSGACDDGSWFEECSVGYRIVVPRDVAVTVETDNGGIRLTAIGGRIDASTDNGGIDATDLRSEVVTAHTDNGGIDLVYTNAPMVVEARADNGGVEIEVPTVDRGYRVDAGSDNGDVHVTVTTDPAADRTIDAFSDNGGVTVRHTRRAPG